MTDRIPVNMSEEQWKAIISNLHRQSETVNDYRKVLNLLHTCQNGRFYILTMTKKDAEDYFAWLDQRCEQHDLSANTVHRYKATLRSLGTRIESHPDVFPNFHSPFAGIIKNEVREKSAYSEKSFATREDIRKIEHAMHQMSAEEQLILVFMLSLGFSGKQIQDLKISDFHLSEQHPGQLLLQYSAGTFLESGKAADSQSRWAEENWPVKVKRVSAGGTTEYEYTASFLFFQNFSSLLKQRCPDLGTNRDTRPFFLTGRHLTYSYRALHHMVQTVCGKAGIQDHTVTPMQISLFGIMRSCVLDEKLREHAALDQKYSSASDPQEKKQIQKDIAENESIFIPLAKNGWIGTWMDHYPIPAKRQADEIMRQIHSDLYIKLII